ncbi:MAG: T9SS type A sorting domain-containing protein [Bacteroidetes bacterium]|nr:T9SS type A sorting domain-containing protein [Bacteroidota bacterium]
MKKFTLLLVIALSIGIVSAQNQRIGNGNKIHPKVKTGIALNKKSSNQSHYSKTKANYFSENFDGTTFPPTGWTTQVLLTAKTWKAGNAYYSDINPSDVKSAICPYSLPSETQNEWLKTPSITGTSSATNLFLKFWAGFSYDYLPSGGAGNPGATLICKISTDGGTTWTELWDADDTPAFTDWLWREVAIDLSAYKAAPFMLAWQVSGADGDLMGLDDIKIVNVSANDCGVTLITTPKTQCSLTNQEQVTIEVKNYGTESLSDIPVNYIMNNGTVVTDTIPGPLDSAETVSFTFDTKVDASTTDVLDSIIAFTTLAVDGDLTNDTSSFHYFMNLEPKTAPYNNTFDTYADMLGMAVVDANADGSSWGIADSIGVDQSAAAYYYYNSSNAGDDWLFSTCIDLAAGVYDLDFMQQIASSEYPEKLEVKIGTSNTAAGMTINVLAPTVIEDTVFTLSHNTVTIATAGTYYVGFHVVSDADMYALFIDNLNIAISSSINENETENQINVYPNPAKESINIESTDKVVSVKIMNVMGQLVEAGMPNSTMFKVNTSNLNSGVYFVQIQTAKGTIVKKINISE